MNEALVVLLGIIWALILLPSALRARRSNPRSTVGGFTRAMDVLRGAPPSAAPAEAVSPVTSAEGSQAEGATADDGVRWEDADAADHEHSGAASGDPARPKVDPPSWARPPRPPLVVDRRARRRLWVLVGLAAVTVVAVVAALVGGDGWWSWAGAAGTALAADLLYLRRSKLQRDFARDIVHAFAPDRPELGAGGADGVLARAAGAGSDGRYRRPGEG